VKYVAAVAINVVIELATSLGIETFANVSTAQHNITVTAPAAPAATALFGIPKSPSKSPQSLPFNSARRRRAHSRCRSRRRSSPEIVDTNASGVDKSTPHVDARWRLNNSVDVKHSPSYLTKPPGDACKTRPSSNK